MASIITVIIFTVLAVGELINDKLPKTPARTAPPIFAARIATGGLAGAALGAWPHWTFTALGAGVIGAVLGTLGGYQARKRLVAATVARICRSRCWRTPSRSWAGSPFLRRRATC